MGGMEIKDGAVSVLDLAGMRHDDNLSGERLGSLGRVIGVVRGNESSLDFLDGNVLAVESNVVTGGGLLKRFVMHLDRLNLRHKAGRGEAALHAGLDDTSLDTSDGHSSDTTDLVHILKGKTKGLVSGALGGVHVVKGFKKGRSLVPGHVLRLLEHVITDPTGDGDEADLGGLVTNLLQVGRHLLLDIVVTRLGVSQESILLRATTICLTPRVKARRACSRV